MTSIRIPLLHQIKLQIKEIMWRKRNAHNRTHVGTCFDLDTVHVGIGTYGVLNIVQAGSGTNILIGNYCSIADDVTFIVNNNHYMERLSTFPFRTMDGFPGSDVRSKGGVVIKDDVWIGYGATILDGVTINQGAVIGAKSVVTKDVPPYAIVVGSPAKVVRYRFDSSIVKKLCNYNFESVYLPLTESQMDAAYTNLTSENLDKICNNFYKK